MISLIIFSGFFVTYVVVSHALSCIQYYARQYADDPENHFSEEYTNIHKYNQLGIKRREEETPGSCHEYYSSESSSDSDEILEVQSNPETTYKKSFEPLKSPADIIPPRPQEDIVRRRNRNRNRHKRRQANKNKPNDSNSAKT